jgi:PAS domain S-box-containing protein
MSASETENLAGSSRPAWLWDPQRRRIVWANAAAVGLFAEDGLLALVERPFDAREPGVAALAAALPAVAEAGERGIPLRLSFPSAGLESPLQARVHAHTLPDGRPGLLVIASAEDAAGAPGFSHVLRDVLESMPLAVAVVDAAARLVYANPAARELLAEEELAGLAAFFAEEEDARAFLRRAAEAGLATLVRDAETSRGRLRFRLTARPAGSMRGQPLFTLVLEDVTERSRLEQALERQVWPPLPGHPGTWQAASGPESGERQPEALSQNAGDQPKAPEKREDESGGEGQPAPMGAGDGAAQASRSENGNISSGKEDRTALPLTEEDIRTFHRLAGEAPSGSHSPKAADGRQPEGAPVEAAGKERAAEGSPAAEEKGEKAQAAAQAAGHSGGTSLQAGPEFREKEESGTAAGKGCEPLTIAGPAKGAAADREDGGVPELVRAVLDRRPALIMLHRDDSLIYANAAARQFFGLPGDAGGWRELLRELSRAGEGEILRLCDHEGRAQAFRLSRDVFPWRDGAVVQTTLEATEDVAGRGAASHDGDAGEEPAGIDSEQNPDGQQQPDDRCHTPTDEKDGVAGQLPAASAGRARRIGGAVRILRPPRAADAQERETGISQGAAVQADAQDGPSAPSSEAGEKQAGTVKEKTAGSGESPPPPAEPLDEELRAILDTATDGIITLNRNGEILSFSAGAEALFGLRTEEVVGRPFAELLEGESRKVVEDYMQALASGNGLAGIYNEGREVTARVAGGGQIPLFITIGKLGRSGEAERPPNKAAFCVVVRDITQWKKTESELRRAKEEAERSSAMKSEFLAAISHELRTPLNAILGFSDVMRNERFGAIGNEKYKGYAHDIYQSGEHLLSLINDLLDLSRIEAGKFELNFEEVDVAAVAEDALKLMKEQAAREKVILRRSIAPDLPRVVADERSLKQILLNLLSNAVKFTGSGGQVVLSARMNARGELEITVSDTGIGMSEEELERALRPFERITGKGRPDKPGTGLGLPLTKALAEANHARFEIESEPGKGTTARIVFPTQRVLA